MKNWQKIFKIVVIVVILFSLFYVFLMLEAKHLIIKVISDGSGRKTTIDKLEIKPPLNLEIKNLEIQGVFKASYIYLSPSIPNLLRGRVALNKVRIFNPQLTYQRIPPPVIVQDSTAVVEFPQAEVAVPVVTAPAPVSQDNKVFPIIIKSLKVKSGLLNFIDSTATAGSIKIIIKDIQFYITNLSTVNINAVSNFNLRASISWNTGEPDGRLFLQGWANFGKKDVLAKLKIEDIDAIVFYPYYSTWVNLEKARIDKAKLNFSSDIKGVNNNVDAVCHLELIDMVRKVRPPQEPQQKAERLTDAVLDMFKSMNQGKVILDFTLHTKMDQPAFGFANIKSAFEGKIMEGKARAGLRPQDMLLWPGKLVQSGVKSGIDLSNAVVDGAVALGNGIKKFFERTINTPASEN
ncbi:MAG: DUF748 domain-containing protein [Candidatus Omnitrophota bacterium]